MPSTLRPFLSFRIDFNPPIHKKNPCYSTESSPLQSQTNASYITETTTESGVRKGELHKMGHMGIVEPQIIKKRKQKKVNISIETCKPAHICQ